MLIPVCAGLVAPTAFVIWIPAFAGMSG